MASACYRRWMALVFVLLVIWIPRTAQGQAPTIEETGVILRGAGGLPTPGTMTSLLGTMPGSSGQTFGMQPGRDDMILGRAGPSAPRVPTSITTPGGVYQGPPRSQGIAAPEPHPIPPPLLYGTMELPAREDEGPAYGLTIDQAVDLLIKRNLDLRAKFLEIPQARADVLTASLRANPIVYGDAQLVPYGGNSNQKPIGPTQYDFNISHPLDLSHKRQARTAYAGRALEVLEAQYQDAVRLTISNLYTAYVDVLHARATVRSMQQSLKGNEERVRITEGLYRNKNATSADVDDANADREVVAVGLLDAQETLQKRKRVLGEMLNVAPEEAERLEVRGRLEDSGQPPPGLAELIQLAEESRPDVATFRLGIQAAQANVKLQRANRFADAYLLYQPFTYQNNAPFDKQSGTSWAVGLTMPVPLYNRNQGNIERALINVTQTQQQLAFYERKVVTEVQQALGEYMTSGRIERRIRDQVLPGLKRAYENKLELFREGEITKYVYLDAQRKYNDTVKAYLDSAARHRRSMLDLNTVVGQRIMP